LVSECISLSRGRKNLKVNNLSTGKTVGILRNGIYNKKDPGAGQEQKITKSGKVKKEQTVRYDSLLVSFFNILIL
jgi:hypothetical protein